MLTRLGSKKGRLQRCLRDDRDGKEPLHITPSLEMLATQLALHECQLASQLRQQILRAVVFPKGAIHFWSGFVDQPERTLESATWRMDATAWTSHQVPRGSMRSQWLSLACICQDRHLLSMFSTRIRLPNTACCKETP